MKIEEFKSKLEEYLRVARIDVNEEQCEKLYRYMIILKEWNEKINLTAIVGEEEILLKHFVDSLIIEEEIPENGKIIDIGTGAGFPGIPLKILREDLDITLIDSLNKRVKFLEEVISKLKLKEIRAIHTRAEDFAQEADEREVYDVSVSRAVANMSTLLEYMLPFVKIGGISICMKGSNVEEELKESGKAIKILGGELREKREYMLPLTDVRKNNSCYKKTKINSKRIS